MKKLIYFLVAALLLGVANSAQAARPQHVYAFGANMGALDQGWGTGLELTNEGDGVYVYRGHMSQGLIGFVGFNDDNMWDTATNDFYFSVQNEYNADLMGCFAKVYHTLPEGFMNYMFNVYSGGDAEIRLTLDEEGEDVEIEFSLEAPEHLYLIGASPSSYDLNNPTEMVSEGNGKFTYDGPLFKDNLTIDCGVGNYLCLRIGPTVAGTDIRFATESTLFYFLYNGGDPRYAVVDNGMYHIEVVFNKDDYGYVIPTVTAERVSDLPSMITVTGHAEHWFSRAEAKKIIYAEPNNPDVFVWTGEITESYDNRWHFCFASNPGYEHTMYVPATTNFETGSYPTHIAQLGVEIPYEEVAGIDENWKFFGIADADFGPIKATLNKATKTVKFEKWDPAGVNDAIVESNEGVKEYYNLQGIRVANPERGIYIMRQGGKVTKIVK